MALDCVFATPRILIVGNYAGSIFAGEVLCKSPIDGIGVSVNDPLGLTEVIDYPLDSSAKIREGVVNRRARHVSCGLIDDRTVTQGKIGRRRKRDCRVRDIEEAPKRCEVEDCG